jgi:hypothetical protein
MSNEAIRIFSATEGFLKERIKSLQIKSREDARKVGPFCNAAKELMYWVNWGTKENGNKIKPYFRRYNEGTNSIHHFQQRLQKEQQENEILKGRDIHKKTQETLLRAIKKLLLSNTHIQWAFNDQRLTDFPLTGNLLSDVQTVEKEYRIKPPFIKYYDLDIALLGEKLHNKNIILGAIEIEYTHEVDLLKCLLCKSLGFPLFTINISYKDYDEITEEWCIKRLTETKYNSDDGGRRNYVYIHNMLYPVFLTGYEEWGIGDKHQYIIFANNNEVNSLSKFIELLKTALSLNDNDVNFRVVNRNAANKGSNTMFENEGALTGENWKEYNPNKFIRLIIKRPKAKSGNIYKFHLVLTQLLTLHFDCLVGYKFDTRQSNFDRNNPIWEVSRSEHDLSEPPNFVWHKKRFCPKRISEPIREIIKYIPKPL